MVPPRHHPGAGRPGALSSSPPFRLRSAKFSGIALQDLRKAFKIRLQMVCVFIMNRMNSQSSGFTQRKRMALGIVILLLVDVIWVASSELTSYVFTQYNKPFFSTFAKTSMFVLYLLGFIVWKPWRQQCTRGFRGKHATFSEPLYVPVKFHDLPSEKPENTNIDTEKRLFTLILAAMFPSNSGDRFTLSKLLAVILSIGGVVLVNLSGSEKSPGRNTIGSIWSLVGAMLYAVYIVMIKRKVDREDKLDIPMFFGFVGLFNLLLLWPGFFLLHYTGFEDFEFPNKVVLMCIVVNGLIGTVLSEFLWLWGCFLTSSLIGTLALSLTIPLSIIADMCMQKVQFSWLFFAGAIPVFFSFFIATLLCHYNNWDPVMVGIRRIFAFICRKHRIQK
ncbi:hypothetical protein G4228_018665 [Cervus hanglu yarkandensis]|nr:hypothetical protein G4228_018665 [Cervus hanglu yarkandensis]